MKNISTAIGLLIAALGLIAIIGGIISIPVWALWNWLMPVIFGLGEITITQAFGLSILSSLLFKSTTSSSK